MGISFEAIFAVSFPVPRMSVLLSDDVGGLWVSVFQINGEGSWRFIFRSLEAGLIPIPALHLM